MFFLAVFGGEGEGEGGLFAMQLFIRQIGTKFLLYVVTQKFLKISQMDHLAMFL